jgi:uncharacterized membrane protein
MKGRTFKGLRGWSGKPLHPPLTDLPIAAYILCAVFDVSSAVAGRDHTWARELWHAGAFIFVGGAAVSVLAALTGLWDWWKSSEAGTQARRTINAHATIMVTVTVLALADIAWRLNDYRTEPVTPCRDRDPVGRHRPAGIGGRHVRRQPGLRLRLQRRDRRRPPGVAQVRDRRVPRPARLTRGAMT